MTDRFDPPAAPAEPAPDPPWQPCWYEAGFLHAALLAGRLSSLHDFCGHVVDDAITCASDWARELTDRWVKLERERLRQRLAAEAGERKEP